MMMAMVTMIQQFERRDDARRIPDITPGLFNLLASFCRGLLWYLRLKKAIPVGRRAPRAR